MNITYRYKNYRHFIDFNRCGATEARWDKIVPEFMEKEYKKPCNNEYHAFPIKIGNHFQLEAMRFQEHLSTIYICRTINVVDTKMKW